MDRMSAIDRDSKLGRLPKTIGARRGGRGPDARRCLLRKRRRDLVVLLFPLFSFLFSFTYFAC